MRCLESGEAESAKALTHGAFGLLAATCCCYNAAAWLCRRERHLAVNAVIYSVVTIWESHKTLQHIRKI